MKKLFFCFYLCAPNSFGDDANIQNRVSDPNSGLYIGSVVANATDRCKLYVVDNYKGVTIQKQSDYVNTVTGRINIGVWFTANGEVKKVHCYIEKDGAMKTEERRP